MDIANSENLLNYCLKKKKSLTPSRTLVIKTLSKQKKPISAYELKDEINNNGDVNINISQIFFVNCQDLREPLKFNITETKPS